MSEIQIVAPQDDWARIQQDEGFIELMRLGRVANSLSLTFRPLGLLKPKEEISRREWFAALMYTAALLKEGLHTARSLGKWFRHLPQYQKGFGDILGDAQVRTFESNTLGKVRDELVFHFDRQAVQVGISRFPQQDVVVATYPEASGPTFAETHFDLADDAILTYLFGDAGTPADVDARIEEFMTRVTDLLKRFIPAAHLLIAVGLVQLGCKRRRAPLPP